MATYNHQSDLININYVTYQQLSGPGQPTGLRIAVFSGKRKEQPLVPSTRQATNVDSCFLQSTLLESGMRRTWATVGALVFQILLLTALVISPLFHTEELPQRETLTMLFAPPPSASNVTFQAPRSTTFTSSSISIPNPKHTVQETPPPPVDNTSAVVGGIPGGMVGGVPGGVLSDMLGSTRGVPVLQKTPEPTNKRMRIASQVAEANLVHDVAPQYPPEAGRERIEGTVVLLAVIGKDGTVQEVRVKSGLPLLAQAAIDAVKQWRYRPYLMNGEPIEVDSQITINFSLSRG